MLRITITDSAGTLIEYCFTVDDKRLTLKAVESALENTGLLYEDKDGVIWEDR